MELSGDATATRSFNVQSQAPRNSDERKSVAMQCFRQVQAQHASSG